MLSSKKKTKNYIFIFCLFFIFNFVSYSQIKFYEVSRNFDNKKDFKNLFLSDYRDIIDLKGTWEYSLDGTTWKNISIPSSYSSNKTITFQKKVFIPEKYITNGNFLLVCYGINYQCEVYINNEFVGHHVGGYASFVFRVPDRIINDENNNTIKIVVHNNLDSKETVPLQQQVGGWKNYGGIFREIYLVSVSPLFFDDISVSHILSPSYNSANIKVSYQITSTELKKIGLDVVPNQKNSFELSFQVIDKATHNVVAQSYSLPFEIESNRNTNLSLETTILWPLLWSPDSPNYYIVRSEIRKNGKVIDQLDVSYGIKDIKIIREDFYLNGKFLELKGINYVEDYPDCGSALSYEQIEKDVISLKNLGINIVNARYHPVNPYFVQLCDKYGIFICQTIPVWNTPSNFFTLPNYNTIRQDYTREMINRDKNNPSIFAWGIGSNFNPYFYASNEISEMYCTDMQNLIKSIDNKHFVYYQTSFITNDVSSSVVDFCMANIDVADIKKFSSLLTIWKNKNENKPIVVNIVGAMIIPENHNGFGDPQSVEYQAHFIFDRFRVLKQQHVNNMFLTTLTDFRSEVPILTVNNTDRFLYTVGVQSYNRENRIAHSMLRALYSDEKTPNLIIGNYNQGHPIFFIIFGLVLLIIFAYIFNTYRRFRENIVRSLLRPFNFYADIRDQRIMSNVQTTMIGLIIVGTVALVTANLLYFYRFSFLLDYILTYILVSNDVKLWLTYQIWDPIRFIFSFIIINLIIIVLIGIFLKLCAIISKKKIYLTGSFAIVIWSALPTICLIPIGMVLSRIIQDETYLLPMLALLVIFMLWFFYRLIKGIAIVLDVKLSKIYFYSLLLFIIVAGSYFLCLDYYYSVVHYFRFVVDMTKGLQI